MAVLNSCDSVLVALKAPNTYYLALYRKNVPTEVLASRHIQNSRNGKGNKHQGKLLHFSGDQEAAEISGIRASLISAVCHIKAGDGLQAYQSLKSTDICTHHCQRGKGFSSDFQSGISAPPWLADSKCNCLSLPSFPPWYRGGCRRDEDT